MEDLIYEDIVECSRRYNKILREEHKCDMVIALTHMRVPNDELLTSMVPELDLVLGGHDHDYAYFTPRDKE
jgi:5'-nucleotidase